MKSLLSCASVFGQVAFGSSSLGKIIRKCTRSCSCDTKAVYHCIRWIGLVDIRDNGTPGIAIGLIGNNSTSRIFPGEFTVTKIGKRQLVRIRFCNHNSASRGEALSEEGRGITNCRASSLPRLELWLCPAPRRAVANLASEKYSFVVFCLFRFLYALFFFLRSMPLVVALDSIFSLRARLCEILR